MNANLFICLTPLQSLIAQQLIYQTNPTPADLLMLCYTDNQKFRYYYQLTANLCRHTKCVIMPKTTHQRLFKLSQLKHFSHLHYQTIFVANINDSFVQYIISHLQFEHLETFDDGVGNLYPTSIFYQNTQHHFMRQILNYLLGIRFKTQDLRALSRTHHTLYPNQANIITNTQPIDFITTRASTKHSGSLKTIHNNIEHKKILLGQPFFQNSHKNQYFFQQIIKHFNIDAYFPHPLEQSLPTQVHIIETPLIFEDWILNQATQSVSWTIYHCVSSAALNVATLSNINLIAIRPNHEYFQQAAFQHLYQLMAQMNIPIVPFHATNQLM